MKVKDIMTPNVIAVVEEATLLEALRKLVESKVSALVALDSEGRPIGVLSEGDLMRRAELGTNKHRPGWIDFILGGGRAAEDYVTSHGRRGRRDHDARRDRHRRGGRGRPKRWTS